MPGTRAPFVQHLDESERMWAVDGSLSRILLPPEPTGGSHHYVIEQGFEMGRPSLLRLRARKRAGRIDVFVGGHVVPIVEGRLL